MSFLYSWRVNTKLTFKSYFNYQSKVINIFYNWIFFFKQSYFRVLRMIDYQTIYQTKHTKWLKWFTVHYVIYCYHIITNQSAIIPISKRNHSQCVTVTGLCEDSWFKFPNPLLFKNILTSNCIVFQPSPPYNSYIIQSS